MKTGTSMGMNPYKLRAILDMIRKQGPLPKDQFDRILGPDDLLVWFDLKGRLDSGEEIIIKRELVLMTEAEVFMELLRCMEV